MIDGGANKSFILREVVELLDLKVVDKEELVIYTFGSEAAEKRTYDIVEGKEDEVNCKDIFANHLMVENEEFNFDRVRNLWSLETIGINPDNEVPLSDKQILKSFEQNMVYTNKRYETRLLWKEDSRELKSNCEIAKRLKKNEELHLKYDEIIKEHLRDGIIERVNLDLDQNINSGYFLPHHAVVCEQKDSTKVRIVFDASSKGKGALSLNDCLESGPSLNPDLLKIILRFKLHKIAFCADIQRAFLEIEIVEEDRQFLKFLWIKKGGPNLDLSTHNVEAFRYTRVTFGVKCSPFLLAAVIRLHVEKYINKYKRACEMLNELYVDDLINSSSDTTEALQLSEERVHILGEAGMNLRRWATNSTTLHET
ncbi:uncharacterized protein TNIN_192211 [Trichonephila inaurata madagascariensis]|uniref:Reverse transcriptase domain-containing protein n=1 Tax=Trichonephila inaurata madagascariensis TaxID=2747483 RepID=A0A8X6IG46_9ARAC|nr:uncharacterized protein TNIN_192211 [Trichonephila inaurata madagascariensis]